ncbi:MAG: hypothetical protein ACTHM7_01195 [Ginsengibacter sp.]
MKKEKKIHEELRRISNLLQDTDFALRIAESQNAAYLEMQAQAPPEFLSEKEENNTIKKSATEEKIATNVAAFYAVECGIGLLRNQHGGTPAEWLNKIVNHQLDSNEILILNRFANATWKAGQPFRGLVRIKKDNFISVAFLSKEELAKDSAQVNAAAEMLLPEMQSVSKTDAYDQLQKLSELLQSKQFALQMAEHIEAAYYESIHQPVPEFFKDEEDTATLEKSYNEEKIAINLAGFYALECGLSYLASAKNEVPSDVIKSITDDRLSKEDKEILERFANATWKAGQPFRSLDRITRKTFTCFDLLLPEEVEKDWIQIKAAAIKLSGAL